MRLSFMIMLILMKRMVVVLVGTGVTEEVQDMQKALNSPSLSSCMLKPSKLLTQGFENNRTAQ